MRKSFFCAVMVFVFFAACIRDHDVKIPDTGLSFFARTENPVETKTIVESQTQVFWEPGDEIAVFSGEMRGKFVANLTAPSATASFQGSFGDSVWTEGMDLWALYPYSEDAVFDGETITTVLPSEQVARAGSFAKDLNLTIAHSTSSTLQFYNVGGGIQFSVTEEGIKKVVFEGRNGEKLAGKIKIGFDENEFPKVQETISGSTSITLLPPEGQECFDTNVWYYLVAIPGALEKGYKLTLVKESEFGERFNFQSLSIKRSIYGSIMYADNGVIFDKPILHFPETESEWKLSVALTDSLSNQIWPLIHGYKESLISLDVVLHEIRDMAGILEAAVNEDQSGIMVMQRDSVCTNYLIREEPETIAESSYPRAVVNSVRSRNASDSSAPILLGDSFVSPAKKALILAPFHSVFCESLDYWGYLLKGQFGSNNVDVLSNNAASLTCFTENYLKQYDFIVISTHGVKGWSIKRIQGIVPVSASYGLLSATPHTAYTIMLLKELGIDPKDCISYNTEQGRFLCMTPKFLSKKELINCAVVLSACNSSNQYMVEAFLSNGARVISSTLTEVNGNANIIYDDMLLTYLSYGLSFQAAYKYVLSSSKTRTAIEALKSITKQEWESIDIPNNYWINNTESFFIRDPFPSNLNHTITNGVIDFSWDCNLEDTFTVSWKDHLAGQGNDMHWEFKNYSYNVRYDLYINGNLVITDISEKHVSWVPELVSSNYSWYVVAKIMEGQDIIESFQSNEETFVPEPEAIDLGLPSGLKWASFNLGASTPEECGDYFAWGEVETYYSRNPWSWKPGKEKGYNWSSYRWSLGDARKMTKYCTNPDYGNNSFVDGKTTLDINDDSAHNILGSNWRMPTISEFEELIEQCTLTFTRIGITSIYGTSGYYGLKVTGPNGNSIVFPPTGYREGSSGSPFLSESGGYYWTSSLHTLYSCSAFVFCFQTATSYVSDDSYTYRYFGFAIRPVYDE